MVHPSFFDNVHEFIAKLAWHVYLWGARMSEDEFLAEHERQAVERINKGGLASPIADDLYSLEWVDADTVRLTRLPSVHLKHESVTEKEPIPTEYPIILTRR